eukprot:m.920136 g.920136  ORF g.920136 m.920136 type:complete len:86 (-) comp61409_c0_seq1:108-365(-)
MAGKAPADAPAPAAATEQKAPTISQLLEEDDEFEEFPAEDWNEADEDKSDEAQWEADWDNDTVEDDFSKQLRAELERAGAVPKTA